MEKSNFTVLLILLVGILTSISCSSGDDSLNANNDDENEMICLVDFEDDDVKVCLKFSPIPPSLYNSCDGGKKVKSCPSNPDRKTCSPVTFNIDGKEYKVDGFKYGGSTDCKLIYWEDDENNSSSSKERVPEPNVPKPSSSSVISSSSLWIIPISSSSVR